MVAGANTNYMADDLLAGKKQKYRFTVTAATQPTTFVIDGATYTSTIATKVGAAEDLKNKVNADGGAVVSASWTTPNEYVDVEGDVAGVAFTIAGLVNLTSAIVRSPSYAITNKITGTSYVQDSDV